MICVRVPRNDIHTLNGRVDAIQRQIPLLQPGTVVTLIHPNMA